jgi:hypothetical protein
MESERYAALALFIFVSSSLSLSLSPFSTRIWNFPVSKVEGKERLCNDDCVSFLDPSLKRRRLFCLSFISND